MAGDCPQRVDASGTSLVAAGLAVLAAIAANDALCCRLLGEGSRGQDHREAIELVGSVRFGEDDCKARERRANSIARNLATAPDLKDQSHCGMSLVEPARCVASCAQMGTLSRPLPSRSAVPDDVAQNKRRGPAVRIEKQLDSVIRESTAPLPQASRRGSV